MKMEFVEFLQVFNEKHVGIATVKFGEPGEHIYLKFKVMPSSKGSGYYSVGPSFKVGEDYKQAIMLDSNWQKEQLDAMIRTHAKTALNGSNSMPQSPSVFAAPESHYSPVQPSKSFDEEIPF